MSTEGDKANMITIDPKYLNEEDLSELTNWLAHRKKAVEGKESPPSGTTGAGSSALEKQHDAHSKESDMNTNTPPSKHNAEGEGDVVSGIGANKDDAMESSDTDDDNERPVGTGSDAPPKPDRSPDKTLTNKSSTTTTKSLSKLTDSNTTSAASPSEPLVHPKSGQTNRPLLATPSRVYAKYAHISHEWLEFMTRKDGMDPKHEDFLQRMGEVKLWDTVLADIVQTATREGLPTYWDGQVVTVMRGEGNSHIRFEKLNPEDLAGRSRGEKSAARIWDTIKHEQCRLALSLFVKDNDMLELVCNEVWMMLNQAKRAARNAGDPSLNTRFLELLGLKKEGVELEAQETPNVGPSHSSNGMALVADLLLLALRKQTVGGMDAGAFDCITFRGHPSLAHCLVFYLASHVRDPIRASAKVKTELESLAARYKDTPERALWKKLPDAAIRMCQAAYFAELARKLKLEPRSQGKADAEWTMEDLQIAAMAVTEWVPSSIEHWLSKLNKKGADHIRYAFTATQKAEELWRSVVAQADKSNKVSGAKRTADDAGEHIAAGVSFTPKLAKRFKPGDGNKPWTTAKQSGDYKQEVQVAKPVIEKAGTFDIRLPPFLAPDSWKDIRRRIADQLVQGAKEHGKPDWASVHQTTKALADRVLGKTLEDGVAQWVKDVAIPSDADKTMAQGHLTFRANLNRDGRRSNKDNNNHKRSYGGKFNRQRK